MTRSPAPRDGVFVLWTLPPVDAATLRAVVADVRRRERERRAVAPPREVR